MNRRSAAAIALAIVCTVLPIAGQLYGTGSSGWLMVDFRAYYCASLAQREHADPYLFRSLHACESNSPKPYYRAAANLAVPAPYPPYALAMIAPLTTVPFEAAAILWWAIIGLCCIVATVLLARVCQQPLLVAWAALALSLGLMSFPTGQIIPICVAALLAAAFCAQRGYLEIAALAIAVAMIEPHVALPAAVGFAVRYHSIRPLGMMALAFALLAAGSLVAGGTASNIEYLTAVLPAHALSEVARDNQYSLSTVIAALGASDHVAILAGGISYVLMLALGTVIGIRLAFRHYEPAFVVLIPPALALLGGSFVHTVEFAAAIPACLLLFTYVRRGRTVVLVALMLLAVPWMGATSAALFLAPVFPIAYLAYVLRGRNRLFTLGSAAGSFAAIVLLFVLGQHPAVHAIARATSSWIDPRLAEASWRSLVLGNSTNHLVTWLLRLPTWIGLLTFAVAGIALGMNVHDERGVFKRDTPSPVRR